MALIDAGEWLGLIRWQIRRVGIPFWLTDEAESQALVILAEACERFDPSFNVPPGAYLTERLRFGLRDWLRHELRRQTEVLTDIHVFDPEEGLEARRQLDQLLFIAARALDAPEYLALLGWVYGASQLELSQILRKNGKQLDELRSGARAKLLRRLESR